MKATFNAKGNSLPTEFVCYHSKIHITPSSHSYSQLDFAFSVFRPVSTWTFNSSYLCWSCHPQNPSLFYNSNSFSSEVQNTHFVAP